MKKIPMHLISRSWVQIFASSAKFTWFARHRKSEILGNNGDIHFLWTGTFICKNMFEFYFYRCILTQERFESKTTYYRRVNFHAFDVHLCLVNSY